MNEYLEKMIKMEKTNEKLVTIFKELMGKEIDVKTELKTEIGEVKRVEK